MKSVEYLFLNHFIIINLICERIFGSYLATSSEPLVFATNGVTNNLTRSNYMYLYKTPMQSANYLNYQAVYGLRYHPLKDRIQSSKESIEELPTVDSFKSEEIFNENQLEAEESVNDESEISTPTSVITDDDVEDDNVTTTNFTHHEAAAASTTYHHHSPQQHIMKPNNRVGDALDFLAQRLKQLIYFSFDKNRPESQLSPHLSSFGRFLSLFNAIRFDRYPCITGRRPLRQLSGTCYNEFECLEYGGIALDRCANGLGVCCVFKAGCSSVTHQNVTYFDSPNFPLASRSDLGTCSLTLFTAPYVKQILVEFIFFELMPPTDGNCQDDRFYVVGQSTNFEVPTICGIASGQHMFIETDDSNRRLQFIINTNQASDRAFSIKITQIINYLSPPGCLQFHTSTDGIISTFNYEDSSQVQLFRRPSYFNNLNYAICIQRQPGYCRILFKNEIQQREDPFELVNRDESGNIINPGQAGAEIFSCPQDFIAVNSIRLCGSKLNDGSKTTNFTVNTPVQSYMNGPIVIPFKTNENTVGRGFKLYYFQIKCDLKN